MQLGTKIAIFKGRKIRKTLHQNEWWLSVINAIEVLTDTQRPRKYCSDLKTKLLKVQEISLFTKMTQFSNKLLENCHGGA